MDISQENHQIELRDRQASRRPTPFGRSVAGLLIALLLASSASVARGAEDIPALIRAARESFAPVSDEQLAAARADLRQRARELERHVRPRSTRGKQWLASLKWNEFKAQLSTKEAVKFEVLATTYQQLHRDEAGLEQAPFRRLAESLRQYVDLASIARREDQAGAYAGQLKGLETEIAQYRERPTGRLRTAIGRRLEVFAGLGQASELVAAVHSEFVRPNALVRVSGDLISASAEPFDRTEPVRDTILGTRLNSTAHSVGTTSLKTVPADDQAIIEIHSAGQTKSTSVGRNGPAVIRSSGTTDFTAVARMEFSETEFRSHVTEVEAKTASKVHSIRKSGGGLGSRMVSRVGNKKARQKHSRAEAIASDHAEKRIASRMTEEADDALADAWKNYEENYRLPLLRRGDWPEHLRFSSTDEALYFEVTQANRAQLAATADPPPLSGDDDVAVRFHETALNNYAASILSGVTISETEPGEGTKADTPLPSWIRDAWKERMDEKAEGTADAEFEPWSLTFRRRSPVTVAFDGAKVTLTLHIWRLTSGGDEFHKWDVSGTFQPEMQGGGVTLRREGELTVLPTGFDTDKDQLSSGQVAVRQNLTKVLTKRSDEGRGFPLSIEIKPLEPKGKLAKVGPLAVGEFKSDAGWLAITWNRM